jgi:hypothetical protein
METRSDATARRERLVELARLTSMLDQLVELINISEFDLSKVDHMKKVLAGQLKIAPEGGLPGCLHQCFAALHEIVSGDEANNIETAQLDFDDLPSLRQSIATTIDLYDGPVRSLLVGQQEQLASLSCEMETIKQTKHDLEVKWSNTMNAAQSCCAGKRSELSKVSSDQPLLAQPPCPWACSTSHGFAAVAAHSLSQLLALSQSKRASSTTPSKRLQRTWPGTSIFCN